MKQITFCERDVLQQRFREAVTERKGQIHTYQHGLKRLKIFHLVIVNVRLFY